LFFLNYQRASTERPRKIVVKTYSNGKRLSSENESRFVMRIADRALGYLNPELSAIWTRGGLTSGARSVQAISHNVVTERARRAISDTAPSQILKNFRVLGGQHCIG
jgi:hypothetical protein